MNSLLLALLVFLLQGFQPQAMSSIEGIVVQAGTSTPVVGATVTFASGRTTTDDAGRFALTNLQPGRYRLFASHGAYVPTKAASSEVILVAGQTVRDVVLGLALKSAISGRIHDSDGNAVTTVTVQAFRYAFQDGRRILVPMTVTQPNNLGEYRLLSLAPGPYIIRATPQAAAAVESAEPPLPIYFPGTVDASSASVVDLPPGVDFSGVNLMMTEARAMRVLGRVVNGLTGEPMSTIGSSITLVPRRGTVATGTSLRGSLTPSGTFEFRHMAPGSYDLVAISTAGGVRLAASQPVAIAGGDVEDVTLVLQPQLSVGGKVQIENLQVDPTNLSLSGVRVELRREPYTPELLVVLPTLAPVGTFTMEGVTPGDYRLKVNTGGLKGYVKSARFGSIDALNPPFRIDGPGQFDIVIGLNSGSVDATVLDNKRKPSNDATVVLVPDPPLRQRFDLYYTAGTDDSGRARFASIAPGDYKVFAWDDVPADAWQDPDFIRAYEDRGEAVHVSEGSTQNVQPRLISKP
jgi:protocatechuate 3,4-dioxygenase beta subunit